MRVRHMETKSPAAWMKEKVYGYWFSQALHCAAALNLADIIHQNGPSRVSELAKKTGSNEKNLYRLLRLLASEEVFEETEKGVFALTPRASQLRSDIPGSQYAMAIMSGSEHYLASSRMIDAVRSGRCAYEIAHGKPLFEYLKDHPGSARIFDMAMQSIHGTETKQMLDAYDFSRFATLMDIGGGNGSLLVEVLRANPGLKGVLFDQGHVIEAVRGFMESHGFANRCQLISGDFFVSVPKGADACLLRHIIHDWDDETSVKLFRIIREVLPANGRMLVVDAVLPEGNTPHPGKLFDWIMMGIPGGVERTEAEFRDILQQGGFKVERIVPTAGLNSIIEAIPA
jgi:hypothetical protein